MKVLLILAVSLVLLSCHESKDEGLLKKRVSEDTAQSSAGYGGLTQVKPVSYEQRQGKYLYTKYCAVCHGEEGKGDGFNAFNLDPRPRDFTDSRYMSALSDARLFETVSEGGRGVNKSLLMPSWGGRLTREEIEYVVSYVNLLRQKK